MRELYGTLMPARRRQLYFVLALMLAAGLAELATIGAVLPFLSLLAHPDRAVHLPILATAFQSLGAVTRQQQLIAATVVFMVLAIAAGFVRLQLSWSSQHFIFRLGHELAVNIQRRILSQPYAFHINQNTSTLVASLEKVGTLVYYVLLQLMQAAISVVISIFVIVTLIYVDPLSALLAAAAIGLIYTLVSRSMTKRLDHNSEIIGRSYDERVKIVQESLAGIRDTIIDSSQSIHLEAFREIDHRHSAAKANTAFIGAAPRFIIEAAGMSLIAGLAMVMAQREGGLAAGLPMVGVLALGAQRVLPMLQQIYVSWSVGFGNRSLVNEVLRLVRLPIDEDLADGRSIVPLQLRLSIEFQNVTFAYDTRREAALDGVSFRIKSGQRIALIGKTGSGKTTLADLLMGLLEPTLGQITVDGWPLTRENRVNWQHSIAHVPQTIFLSDASIARNVALGVPRDQIELPRVIEAIRKAQLDEFVADLPEGIDTFVGERGVRLSGGQRQLLGIARAIYKQAPVLVLDEATSALDDATETAVMRALDHLEDDGRTIVIIAHRMSTIAGVDLVVRLENGRVAEVGSYIEVIGSNPQVRTI